jgi:hypothetical protein
MLENRVLRRIFGPTKEDVTAGSKKIHNEELKNFSSRNINRMIKSRKMKWARHVVTYGKMRKKTHTHTHTL